MAFDFPKGKWLEVGVNRVILVICDLLKRMTESGKGMCKTGDSESHQEMVLIVGSRYLQG